MIVRKIAGILSMVGSLFAARCLFISGLCADGAQQPAIAQALSPDSETKPPAAPALRFRFDAVSDKSLGLWDCDRPVFVYNHCVLSQPGGPATHKRSTYIHPIYGLDAEVLTDHFPADHVGHRGRYFA